MAMIDYGAIAFKNGKLLTQEMFTEMREAVGWEDTEEDIDIRTKEPIELTDNYFTYIGDSKLTIGFYKNTIIIVGKCKGKEHEYLVERQFFADYPYTWTKWETCHRYTNITVTKKNGYYVLKCNYNGDKYKVYFGYGVDIDSYKKWHIVNYYRSLPHFIHSLPFKIKNLMYDLRYR